MTLYVKVCQECGKRYEGQIKSTFCSRACRNSYYARSDMLEAKRPKVCEVCSKKFMAFRSNARYCSRKCLERAGYRRKIERLPRRPFPKQALWTERRKQAFKESGKICWLCGKRMRDKFQLHHLDYGDHSPESKRLIPLHPRCHNFMHHIQVSVTADGFLSFHGRALDLLKKKGV